MKLTDYLKEKITALILLLFFSVSVMAMSKAFNIINDFSIAIVFIACLFTTAVWTRDFLKRRKFYNDFTGKLSLLDLKYLIAEMLQQPDFFEGRLIKESLYEIDKSMIERISAIEKSKKSWQEYIELWIHEIKLPISSLELMNYNKSQDFAKQKVQIDRLHGLTEQILFFARADNPHEDYLIKKTSLSKVINKAVLNHKDTLLAGSASIVMGSCDFDIYTDAKWLEFIISQIISNSIKYKSSRHLKINFSSIKERERVILEISDNGIGIPPNDLPRIFEHTFTGNNGRSGQRSTGMGLYICRRLCDKLGHKITASSTVNEKTSIYISFGLEHHYLR